MTETNIDIVAGDGHDLASEVAAILAEGGFKPMPAGPEQGLYCRQVGNGWWMGGEFPEAGEVHSKACYGDPRDAARDLVAHARARVPENALTTEATLEPPSLGADILAAEGETGENPSVDTTPRDGGDNEPGGENPASEPAPEAGFAFEVSDVGSAETTEDGVEPAHEGGGAESGDAPPVEPIDADFTAIEGDEAYIRSVADASEASPEPEPDAGGSQFIFGDNLDQMRTAAIGLVMRHARAIMPTWSIEDDTALVELRNFTMGVSEGRWPDDAGRRADLDALEATLARLNAIARARDEKVEFLESAGREDIAAFDATAGWPS